jgi:hypothetical protein
MAYILQSQPLGHDWNREQIYGNGTRKRTSTWDRGPRKGGKRAVPGKDITHHQDGRTVLRER